jgi:putative radical SAM enzyme (TIGR03279 family)
MKNKTTEHKIKEIGPGGIAEELELEPGDVVVSVNGQEIEDVFDYHYLTNEEYLTMVVRKADGEEWELEIEKEFEEDLGIVFENSLMDEYRSCRNKCIFCFIDQMPKGMRETLYFKDDDSRLSFLQGNYVTLTNMSDHDIDRIIRYHLEPINISFHTMNPELRCKMLNNRFAGDIFPKVERMAEAGIELNGQIVLCKGVNDGAELEYSIEQLTRYLPALRSVSVVPVGLTKFRDGLYPLEPFEAEDAVAVIDLIESWQKKIYAEYGIHFIHASDEWYILAGREFPEAERYDGYLQLENGVGMMRLLYEETMEALQENPDLEATPRELSLATGRLAAPFLEQLSEKIREQYPQVKLHVHEIRNDFFGERITVAGLITGTDLIHQLKGQALGEELLLPINMLRSGERVFLDDITVEELEKALQIRVRIVKSSGYDFVSAVIGQKLLSVKEDLNE